MSGQAGPIRMGVIGYGRAVVQMHAPEIRALGDKFKIVAVCVRSHEGHGGILIPIEWFDNLL
jgi:predicted dehydrogenase